MTVTAVDVVRTWLDAWQSGDEKAARAVLDVEYVLHATVPTEIAGEHIGFDAFVYWYGRKRQLMAQSGYRLDGLLASAEYAAVRFVLSGAPFGGTQEWRQIAIYRVGDGHIKEIWLHEDEPRQLTSGEQK